MQGCPGRPMASYIYGDPNARPGSGIRSHYTLDAAASSQDFFLQDKTTRRSRSSPPIIHECESDDSSDDVQPDDCVCPNCMTTIKKVYVLTDIEDINIEHSQEPLELLGDREQVHYLRAHVTKLELALKEASERLSSLNLRMIESTRTDLPRDVIQLPAPPLAPRQPRRAHDWDM